MPVGLLKKVGNYCFTGGLKLELFLNQNCPESHQLTRMVVTHVHTIHARGKERKKKKKKKKKGKKKGGKKKKKKKRKKKKVGRSQKVGIPTKVGKTASLTL